jgi:hypothetical protein
MAHVRFKTTIEVEVEVVGSYVGETPARGMMGPPEDSEPGEPEDFEVEAVMLEVLPGSTINLIEVIEKEDLEGLREMGIEEARQKLEDQYLEQQIAREEARREGDR